ncbi:MAG TPA: metallopeptidase TldD-related protein [Longimicrobium sp.]|nr:metallopeptidase TldD-related protein [Longimicrobium sp.]
MADNRYLTRSDAEALAQKVLSFSTADEARVNINSGTQGNTRFAQNQVSTAGDAYDATITVTSAFGKKTASATTNRFDDESLRGMVQTSERLARLVPEDPEYMGELDPQQYIQSEPYFEATAAITPEARARAVMEIAGPAMRQNLVSTGFLSHLTGSTAVANKRGLFAYARGTNVSFTTTVRTADGTGSGWAGGGENDWSKMNFGSLAETAIRKAELSRNPRAVEPGEWTVILEPTAVANLVNLMVFALNARNADEGRSFFSKQGGGNKLGEKFLDERISITSDPADPRTAGSPFSGEGLPNRAMTWVENGVLRNLIYNRFWAARNNTQPTGFPGAYRMTGGNASMDEMIRSTDRGLLVTRLWYIRPVDPRTILFTGLTRDGTFLIENGRITTAVKNLRWNESPVFMLNNIDMMGQPVRVNASEDGAGGSVMVPPIKSRDFTFTSLSDAV